MLKALMRWLQASRALTMHAKYRTVATSRGNGASLRLLHAFAKAMTTAESSVGKSSQAWNPDQFKGVIFDVGMHDGTDTASYLSRGYAVLAIEADPTLVSSGAERFDDAIRRGQLQILNIGIGEQEGASTFWICDDNSVWNSFDERIASRNGCRHHAIRIVSRPFRAVLDEFGVPEYLKIDIEGAESAGLVRCASTGLPLEALNAERVRLNLALARTNCVNPEGDVARGPADVGFRAKLVQQELLGAASGMTPELLDGLRSWGYVRDLDQAHRGKAP